MLLGSYHESKVHLLGMVQTVSSAIDLSRVLISFCLFSLSSFSSWFFKFLLHNSCLIVWWSPFTSFRSSSSILYFVLFFFLFLLLRLLLLLALLSLSKCLFSVSLRFLSVLLKTLRIAVPLRRSSRIPVALVSLNSNSARIQLVQK